MIDARTPSDHHQDAQDALVDRNAAEDFEESGGLEREGLALLRRERPFLFTASDDNPREVDRRCFGRGEADNPQWDGAA